MADEIHKSLIIDGSGTAPAFVGNLATQMDRVTAHAPGFASALVEAFNKGTISAEILVKQLTRQADLLDKIEARRMVATAMQQASAVTINAGSPSTGPASLGIDYDQSLNRYRNLDTGKFVAASAVVAKEVATTEQAWAKMVALSKEGDAAVKAASTDVEEVSAAEQGQLADRMEQVARDHQQRVDAMRQSLEALKGLAQSDPIKGSFTDIDEQLNKLETKLTQYEQRIDHTLTRIGEPSGGQRRFTIQSNQVEALDTAGTAAGQQIITQIDTAITKYNKLRDTMLQVQSAAQELGQKQAAADDIWASGIDTLNERLVQLRERTLNAFDGKIPAQYEKQLQALENRIDRLSLAQGQKLDKVGLPGGSVAQIETQLKAIDTANATFQRSMLASDHALDGFENKLNSILPASGKAKDGLIGLDGELKQKKVDADHAESALGKLGSRLMFFLQGSLIYQGINKIGEAIGGLAKALIGDPAQVEQWTATYARLFHDVGTAKSEMDTIISIAPKFPQTIDQIVDVDQKILLLLGNNTVLTQKFGQSLSEVRQVVLDTGAALPKLDMTNLVKSLQLLQDRPGDALRSLERTTGVTREQLALMGVEFDKSGKQIYSSYSTTFNAVTDLLKMKYGGMGEVQSSTFLGMVNNAKDFMFRIATALGQDTFTEIRGRLRGLLDSLDSTKHPEVAATLADWGDKLGRLAHAGFTAFDEISKGIQNVLALIRPLTDALGGLIGSLPKDTEDAFKQMENYGKAALIAADTTQDMSDTTQEISAQQIAWEHQLVDLQHGAEAIRYSYQKQTDELDKQERALDRIYNKGKQDRDIEALKLKIAQDIALSKDRASSQGRSAAERLPEEQARLTDLYEQQSHDKKKQNLEDLKQTAKEHNQDALRGNQLAQDEIQGKLKALQESTQFPAKLANEAKNQLGAVAVAYNIVLGKVEGVMSKLGLRHATFSTDAKGSLDEVRNKWDETMAFLDKQAPRMDSGITAAVDRLTNALTGGKNGLIGALETLMLDVETVFTYLHDNGHTILGRAAENFAELGDQVAFVADKMTIALYTFQGLTSLQNLDSEGFKKAAAGLSQALTADAADQALAKARHTQFTTVDDPANQKLDDPAKWTQDRLDLYNAKQRAKGLPEYHPHDSPSTAGPDFGAGAAPGGGDPHVKRGPDGKLYYDTPSGAPEPPKTAPVPSHDSHENAIDITIHMNDAQANEWFQHKVRVNAAAINRGQASYTVSS